MLLGRICRTCLKKSDRMHKLREVVQDDLSIEDMLNQAISNFDLEMDDTPLPVEICKNCLSKLQTTYDFVQMCLKNNEELKNVLNQQEQEIEGTLMTDLEEINPMEIDILMHNFKKESNEDNTNGNGAQERKLEVIKSESESHHEDNSSSEEYWPNEEKEESESNFFEDMTKGSLEIKQKKKNKRKVSVKRSRINTCLHCNKEFSRKILLTKHLTVHDPENKFVCSVCKYRYSSEMKLNKHTNEAHTDIDLRLSSVSYPSADGSMIFQEIRALNKDMNCKLPDLLPYKCNVCEEEFPLEVHLNEHLNEHMGYKKHKCNFCEKRFPNITTLKDHLRKHTGETPFLCPHCGNSFKTANLLRLHSKRHGEKNFHCTECPMKFFFKEHLNIHMTSHTKLRPHVCDICGSAFTRIYTLRAHKFIHTGERPFKCGECNMSFVFKRHLKRHNLTHTGEKPHTCTFCDRAYAASGDLVKHLRTHVGEKTYFCDQCPEAFKYSIDLKDHKAVHYKQKTNLQHQQSQNETEDLNNETII